jgi:hypothetical protein
MAENACRPVGHLEGAGPVRRCPSWCITVHDRDWVSHEGTAATFTFTDPSSRRQETILRAEIILIAECDEDMLRDPIVYVDGCGSALELDQVGLDVYIEGLERHVQDMRAAQRLHEDHFWARSTGGWGARSSGGSAPVPCGATDGRYESRPNPLLAVIRDCPHR